MNRRNCNPRKMVAMPPLELGLIMRFGGVPVVMSSLRDPQMVRAAIETAIRNAGAPVDVAGREELRLFAGLLERLG